MNVMLSKPPPGKPTIALVMQGGGALGAYEAGAVARLCADFHPVAVAGVSIGAVNAAAIAGAPGGDIAASLERLWVRLMVPFTRFMPDFMAENMSLFGNPAMYQLRSDFFFLPSWTSFCDVAPLRRTLLELCDFEQINNHEHMRFAVTATEVATGKLHRFLNTTTTIKPEHVQASGALPPGFPWAGVENGKYWDGGLYDNTPVRPTLDLLTDDDRDDLPIVLINLFPDGTKQPMPTTMKEVSKRHMELTYQNKFWDEYGGVEGVKEYAEMIRKLDEELPKNSPIRNDPTYTILRKRRRLKNLHVIDSDRAPRRSGMDFSERSISDRFERGYKTVDKYIKEGRLDLQSGRQVVQSERAHAA